MNEEFRNKHESEDSELSNKLNAVAEQINLDPHFMNELEQKLRSARKPKARWQVFLTHSIFPTLGWAALVIAIGWFLSWSIRNLIPNVQPASNATATSPAENTPEATTPTPEVNPTATLESGGYDFRGAKLIFNQPMPESPAQANVYQSNQDRPATAEEARALAVQFGIQSEVYTVFDYVFNLDDYYFIDGKQALQVYSTRRFTYTADLSRTSKNFHNTPNPNADTIISGFLKSHGFDFPTQITATDFFGAYRVEPLAPDGLPIQYESFTYPPILIHLDENGNVLSLDASLMDFESTPVGTYGILSAQEALNKLLNDAEQGGKSESFSAKSEPPQEWYRIYPDNQTITIQGYVSSYPAADASQPTFITIDGVPAIGNTSGLENLERATFIAATGQYILENDIRKFNVNSWESNIQQAYLSGKLQQDGDQILFIANDGNTAEYPLIDPPSDLPLDALPNAQLSISGLFLNGKMDWYFIQYFESINHGGGGGGGGLGFYKLNLSGTPVPFPTSIPQPDVAGVGESKYIVQENDTLASIAANFGVSVSRLAQANDLPDTNIISTGQELIIPKPGRNYTVKEGDTLSSIADTFGITVQELMQTNNIPDPGIIMIGQFLLIPGAQEPVEQRVTGLRGFLSIVIHKKTDGTQTREYHLVTYQNSGFLSYLLEGSNLTELDAYNSLPILISGTIHPEGAEKLIMDSYQIPFPDLKFQILQGIEDVRQINGQLATIFTTQTGQAFAEFLANTDQANGQIVGVQGDLIQAEVLIVPNETFGGLPVLRVFQSSTIDGVTELQVTADQPQMIDDSLLPEIPNSTRPNLIIDSVELAYYMANPYYQVNGPSAKFRSTYIQPVWHFHGYYTDGSEFDMLIQALKPEFLLPELVPRITPG